MTKAASSDRFEIMNTIISYPEEIQLLRERCFAEINAIKARYEAEPVDLTATAIVQRKNFTPRDILMAYQMECEPFVQQLVKLEAFAAITVVMDTDAA